MLSCQRPLDLLLNETDGKRFKTDKIIEISDLKNND